MSAADGRAATTALAGLGLVPDANRLSPEGLTLTLVPREDGLASKDVPVEALFHKITMMRDKLRVLEQRINAADGLSTGERAALQARITAAYGSFAGLVAFFSTESLPVVGATATTDDAS